MARKILCIVCTWMMSVWSPASTSAQTTGIEKGNEPAPAIRTDTNYVQWIHGKIRFAKVSDSMLALADEGIKLAQALGYDKGHVRMLLDKSHLLQGAGDFSNSLDLSLKALRLSERMKDSLAIGYCYQQMMWMYSDQKNYTQLLSMGYSAIEIARLTGDDAGRTVALLDIGDTYEKMDVLDSARIYTQQCYELAVKINKAHLQGVALNNLGNIYAKMEDPEIALGYYRKSIPLQQIGGLEQTETYLGMARIFEQTGHLDSAFMYGRLSLHQADSLGYIRRQMLASKFISDLYARTGRPDSSLSYLQLFVIYKDSAFSEEKTRQVQEQTFREQQYQRDLAEERLQSEERRKHNIQLAGIGAFIPLFFIIVLLLSRTKVKPRTVEVLGLIGLLLFFQFIELLIHPYIASVSGHTPVIMLFLLVILAGLLIPFHKRLEHWVKDALVRRGK